jgi:hypothetical protein
LRSRLLLAAALTLSVAAASPALAAKRKPAPAPPPAPATVGYDISYPQCGAAYPRTPAFGIVGVTKGLPWSGNPCLASEYAWAAAAAQAPAFYVNTANPGSASVRWTYAGPRACSGTSDDLGCAYNYGWNAAKDALTYAVAQTGLAAPRDFWLDVETGNSWSSTNLAANAADLSGARDYLLSQTGYVARVGVYSTGYQWNRITGSPAGWAATPNWLAGAPDASTAPSYCSRTFTGAKVELVQYIAGGFDNDHRCG